MEVDQGSSAVSNNAATTFKFPSYPGNTPREDSIMTDDPSDRGLSPVPSARDASHWTPRRTTGQARANGTPGYHERRGRQKSLSEALRTIHNRRGSITDNAREIGEALKAPVSFKLIVSTCRACRSARLYTDISSFSVVYGIWPRYFPTRPPRRFLQRFENRSPSL